MTIPSNISVPPYPKFIFAPDAKSGELYIVCSRPLTLIWVRQTIPAQLFIVEGPQQEEILREAAEFYRQAAGSYDKN